MQIKTRSQNGYFLPLAVLFAGILTATWATKFKQNDQATDYHESSRVFDELLFWQRAVLYYRIDHGEWPLTLTTVESAYNMYWRPNYLTGSQVGNTFIIEYHSTNEEVLMKLPESPSLGLERVHDQRIRLTISTSRWLEPDSAVLISDQPMQALAADIHFEQHNLNGTQQLTSQSMHLASGFSLTGNFEVIAATEITSNRVTTNDIIINGRSFNADLEQLQQLYTQLQSCVEVTRYCL